jgi:tetratricopeptide (TPR) repeat protein
MSLNATAKVLRFPTRTSSAWLTPREADAEALVFLALPEDKKTDAERARYLGSPDVLLAICARLRQRRDLAPAIVFDQASDIYRWIAKPSFDLGLFDERDYFLGEVALLAGATSRQLGRREDAFLWLDRAEAGFRHTMNPAPGLANVAYARLSLRFEMARYEDVLELAPSLEASFAKLRMMNERAKCRLLRAMTLKQVGDLSGAVGLLDELRREGPVENDRFLASRILAELGDLRQLEGRLDLAMQAFQEALSLLHADETSLAKADLKLYVGGVLKASAAFEKACDAFRDAQREYRELGMRSLVAYTHLVIAETLLASNRQREAEWEILAALPSIEELDLLPEAVAAAALLRESVQRRQTNPKALQDLRTLLQAS